MVLRLWFVPPQYPKTLVPIIAFPKDCQRKPLIHGMLTSMTIHRILLLIMNKLDLKFGIKQEVNTILLYRRHYLWGKIFKREESNIKIWGIDTYGSVFKKYHETGIFDEMNYPYITEGIGEDILQGTILNWLINLKRLQIRMQRFSLGSGPGGGFLLCGAV